MNRTNSILIGVLSLGMLSGCAQGDLPEYNQLGPLRIFSLKVDPPEAAPGDFVILTPYLSDLNGKGRSLTYSIEACPDPGLNRGIDPSCEGVTGKVAVANGTIDPSSNLTFKSPNFTGRVNRATITVPTDLLSGKSAVEQMVGVDYIVVYKVEASDGKSVTSVKRIRVSSNSNKNANPAFSSVQANGASVSSLPSSATALTAQFSSGSQESYGVTRSDGSTAVLTETLITTWFISDGSFDYTRTYDSDSNTYTPPSSRPTEHNIIILGVARDGRGGEDVIQLDL
jgi:hypothetical protein